MSQNCLLTVNGSTSKLMTSMPFLTKMQHTVDQDKHKFG